MESKTWFILGGLFFIYLAGCGETTRMAQLDPTVVPHLRGDIQLEKKIYEIGEPIVVKYWIINVSEEKQEESVTDGSKDPAIPFQRYSFNAASKENREEHLVLVEAGIPFDGNLVLEPGAKQLFVQNTFTAEKEGTYVLSMELDWSHQKRIAFTPITIGIKPKMEPKPLIDPELAQAISQLHAEEEKILAQARKKILSFQSKAAPLLLSLLSDENKKIKSEAKKLLMQLGKEAISALEIKIMDPDKEMRKEVIEILMEIGDFKTIPALKIALLRDPDKEIRLLALEAIAENFANETTIPLMILAMEDPELEVRKQALQVIRNRAKKLELDFPVDAPLEKRKKAILLWREWWEQRDPTAFKRFSLDSSEK